MARAKKQQDDEDSGGEIPAKDFKTAHDIYRRDMRPAASKRAEFDQELSTASKAVKKQCHLVPAAASKAFKLHYETEDTKRDDWIESFCGCLNEAAGREVVKFNRGDLFSPRPTLVKTDED